MANATNQRERLLHLAAALMELTDDEHTATIEDLTAYLAEHGIDAERKALYRDMHALAGFGLTAEQTTHGKWRLAERPFTTADLRLLIDAVQASPVLSQDQADGLTERLMRFASAGMREELAHAVEVPACNRSADGRVHESISAIRRAMAQGRKVAFSQRYLAKGPNGVHERVRGAGSATPVRIVFAQERYWLVVWFDRDAAHEGRCANREVYVARRGKPHIHLGPDDRGWFDQFRIDFLEDVRVSDEPATRNAQIACWRLEDSDAPQFGVKGAAPEPVVLGVYAGGGMLDAVLERFAGDCDVFPQDGFGVRVHVRAPLSPEFFGWLSQFGSLVRIEGPSHAREAYCEHLRNAAAPPPRWIIRDGSNPALPSSSMATNRPVS